MLVAWAEPTWATCCSSARWVRSTSLPICEVDGNRLAAAVKSVGNGCEAYRDYRGLLDRKDIDAVIIASPDHWHAVQTVHACEAGKHVYVEKPASCTIAEGRAMVAAARKHNRVVQVGSQARSAEPAHQAAPISATACWER